MNLIVVQGPQSVGWAVLSPLLAVVVTALAVLLLGVFGARRPVLWGLAGLGLAGAFGAVVALACTDASRATFCGFSGCSYATDSPTLLLQGVVLAGALVVVLLSAGSLPSVPVGEYAFLLLCAVAGALTVAAGRDLITLVVALEALSLPVFALVALDRYDGVASEAAVKLLLVSVVSTAVTLLGVSLVYGATGSMYLSRIAAGMHHLGPLREVALVGAVLVLGGFLFKVAVVPFHFWAPDVYQGAPVPVAAFLSVVSKAAGFAGLVAVLVHGFPSLDWLWQPVLGVLAAVTMTLGNLLALRQVQAVRLLAWSSVAQSGYMLAPLAGGAGHAAATVGYVAFYAAMNLAAFGVVVASRRLLVADYDGLGRTSPLLGAALAFALVCLAGLPPGVMGLLAKVVVVRATVAGGATWLGVVIGLNTVLGLAYYLPWAARLYRRPATGATPGPPPGAAVRLAVGAASLAAVVLSVAPQLVLDRLGG